MMNADGLRLINQYDDEWWTNDIPTAEKTVRRFVKIDLTSNQYSALVSFAVTITAAQFKNSAVVRLLNRGLHFAAMDDLLTYTYANGREDKVLIKRRSLEKALFLKPERIK